MTDRATPPMDDERCLFVLSLLLDDRPVEPELAAAARAWAAARPELLEVERDWTALHEVLAADPGRRAGEGFTRRVVAAAGDGRGAAGGELLALPLVRRLVAAAALLVASLLVFDLSSPADLHADASRERLHHAVDGFRATPWQADEVEAGLRARLTDPAFRPPSPYEDGAGSDRRAADPNAAQGPGEPPRGEPR